MIQNSPAAPRRRRSRRLSYQLGGNLVVGVEGDFGWGGNIAENSLDEVSFAVDPRPRCAQGSAGRSTTRSSMQPAAPHGRNGRLSGVFGGLDGEDTRWHMGWTAGIGMEQALSDSLRFRLEYLYARLDDKEYEVTCGCTIDAGLDKSPHRARRPDLGLWRRRRQCFCRLLMFGDGRTAPRHGRLPLVITGLDPVI